MSVFQGIVCDKFTLSIIHLYRLFLFFCEKNPDSVGKFLLWIVFSAGQPWLYFQSIY